MNISPVTNQQQTNFKGWLKFKNGRYINSNQITSVLYDYLSVYGKQNTDVHSTAFIMSDGLKYIVRYLTKPTNPLINRIIEANKSPEKIVEVPANIIATNKLDNLMDIMQYQNCNQE